MKVDEFVKEFRLKTDWPAPGDPEEEYPDQGNEIRVNAVSMALLDFVRDVAEEFTVSSEERDALEMWIGVELIKSHMSRLNAAVLAERKGQSPLDKAEKGPDEDPGEELGPLCEVENLDLSVRAYSCLKESEINTVQDLCERTWNEIRGIKHMNKATAAEIRDLLTKHGLYLRGEGPET